MKLLKGIRKRGSGSYGKRRLSHRRCQLLSKTWWVRSFETKKVNKISMILRRCSRNLKKKIKRINYLRSLREIWIKCPEWKTFYPRVIMSLFTRPHTIISIRRSILPWRTSYLTTILTKVLIKSKMISHVIWTTINFKHWKTKKKS